jgi:hypothetical protein
MKVYAIYSKENKFLAAFPTREDAEWYGKTTYGRESGWQYDIVEKYLHEYSSILSNTPDRITPVPLKTTPYIPNIWCEGNGPKATYDEELK